MRTRRDITLSPETSTYLTLQIEGKSIEIRVYVSDDGGHVGVDTTIHRSNIASTEHKSEVVEHSAFIVERESTFTHTTADGSGLSVSTELNVFKDK